LRLGQISDRLGFAVTAEFLARLGITHVAKEKSAILYHERDFASICYALLTHINSVYEQHQQAA